MSVREIVFEYKATGASRVAKQDAKVRSSVRETGKVANRQAGAVQRWMERNRQAIRNIGMAAAGAMAGILAMSPTFRAQLSGIRTAFTLLADTIVRDVLPSGTSLGVWAIQAVQWFRDLDDSIRRPISGFLALVGVIGGLVALAAPVVKAFSIVAGAITGILGTIGALIAGYALLIAATLAFVAAYITNWRGTRDKTDEFVNDILDRFSGWLSSTLGISEEMTRALLGAIAGPSEELPKHTETLRRGVMSKLADFRDDILGWASDVASGFARHFRNIVDWIQRAIDRARELRSVAPEGALEGGNFTGEFTDRVGGGGTDISIGGIDVDMSRQGTNMDVAREVSDELERQLGGRGV